MRWLLGDSDGYEEITQRFAKMLEDGRTIFCSSADALLGRLDPESIRGDLFATDQRINLTEQEIRRLIVVHATVHGAATFPAMLVMMSMVKDAERIGDYAKNIFDLAAARVDLGGGKELERITSLRDRIAQLLEDGRALHEAEDAEGARAFLAEADKVEDACDVGLDGLLDVKDRNMAGPVLAFRYFKRTTSHMANVVTALVMPLDKLDYFDEP